MVAGAAGVDVPHQGRPCDQTARQFGQAHAGVVRQGLDAAIVAFEYDAAGRGQQRSRKGFSVAAADLVDADAAVDVFLQQLLRTDQIELEVLFDDPCAHGVGQRFKKHGGRINQRRDIGEAHVVAAADECEIALLAHHGIAGHGGAASAAAIEFRR
ncbi:MAG: DUF429 domain-containing protein [Burkholderiales bacterium]